jgi:hypothetical protein
VGEDLLDHRPLEDGRDDLQFSAGKPRGAADDPAGYVQRMTRLLTG